MIKRLNGQYSVTFKAGENLHARLKEMRGSVRTLYKHAAVGPAPVGGPGEPGETYDPYEARAPARRPLRTGPMGIDEFLTGTVDELARRSVCSVDEFLTAAEEGDLDFILGLGTRLVIWRVMLLDCPEADPVASTTLSGRRGGEGVRVSLTAGGKAVFAEFPPDGAAARLTPGASMVIAGEVREAEDAWVIHVVAWELTRKIGGGLTPLTKCVWPEPAFEPWADVPDAAGE